MFDFAQCTNKTCESKRFNKTSNGAFTIFIRRHTGNNIHYIIEAICPEPLSIILPLKERIRLKSLYMNCFAVGL